MQKNIKNIKIFIFEDILKDKRKDVNFKKTLLFLKFMITLTIKEKKGKNYEIRKIQQNT